MIDNYCDNGFCINGSDSEFFLEKGISIPCKYNPPPRHEWDIYDKDLDYETDHPLGAGKFGEVYIGFWKIEEDESDEKGLQVAIKVLKPPEDITEKTKIANEFKKETDSLKKLQHPKVVRLHG